MIDQDASPGAEEPCQYVLLQAEAVQQEDGISCEVIDLRTLLPWDRETVGEVPSPHPKCLRAACPPSIVLQAACAWLFASVRACINA